ncbi:MAG TPA: hypothetical protein VMM18_11025 [Gemmatimonadaceae bacterium]|nr:hypothetical protein [Gemmatimonadaceae bacterium]
MQIGTVEGDPALQFFEIAGIVRLDDGAIVVLDGGARELRYFGADGRFINRAGPEAAGQASFAGQ